MTILAQQRCDIGGMDITTCMNYIVDGIRMTVMDHPKTAGKRTIETFTLPQTGFPKLYTTEADIAVIEGIYLEGKRKLTQDEYSADADRDIYFTTNNAGPYKIIYRAFPDTSDMADGTEIPLPKQFQEALVWYVAAQYYGREMTHPDANATYLRTMYNNYCGQASEFYMRSDRRRIPARRV
jgi:hypothetical protein